MPNKTKIFNIKLHHGDVRVP